MVYSDGMALEAIGGTGVNLGGKRVKVAYLVAWAFVPTSECREYVRHKNGDVTDNRASNLEWCDEKEKGRRRGPKPALRRLRQYDLDGDLVGEYGSVAEAAEATGLKGVDVRAAANRKGCTGGYRWLWV